MSIQLSNNVSEFCQYLKEGSALVFRCGGISRTVHRCTAPSVLDGGSKYHLLSREEIETLCKTQRCIEIVLASPEHLENPSDPGSYFSRLASEGFPECGCGFSLRIQHLVRIYVHPFNCKIQWYQQEVCRLEERYQRDMEKQLEEALKTKQGRNYLIVREDAHRRLTSACEQIERDSLSLLVWRESACSLRFASSLKFQKAIQKKTS